MKLTVQAFYRAYYFCKVEFKFWAFFYKFHTFDKFYKFSTWQVVHKYIKICFVLECINEVNAKRRRFKFAQNVFFV